ncbi:MAG: rod shape-determining protein MreC [Patescibacteria group bacterium]|mgnify:CR=1 FL=1
MKTHFHRQHKEPFIVLAGGIILVVIILFLIWRVSAVSDVLSRGMLRLGVPLLSLEQKATESAVRSNTLVSKKTLIKDNEALREENAAFRVSLLGYSIIKKENEELRSLLGRTGLYHTRILSAVLSKPPRAPYDTLIIDVGTEDGISQGDRVFAFRDVAIGTVVLADESASKVKLFSSPGEDIDVVVGDDHIAAIAHGRGGGNFELRLPRGVHSAAGDPIVFPSMGIEIAGVVEYVESDPSSSFQTVIFKSPVNMFELRFVEVQVGGGGGTRVSG